jgi:hypothetical protein
MTNSACATQRRSPFFVFSVGMGFACGQLVKLRAWGGETRKEQKEAPSHTPHTGRTPIKKMRAGRSGAPSPASRSAVTAVAASVHDLTSAPVRQLMSRTLVPEGPFLLSLLF